MHNNKAFTLVEILIVVIILGILAAIVIPQFTEASNEARDSAVRSDLQTIRSQVELYKIQHLDQYPGETDSNNTTIEVTDSNAFKDDLTAMTNEAGGTSSPTLGPYLGSFPKNPFITDAALKDLVTFGTVDCPGNNLSGWYLNTTTGRFSANDDAHEQF